MNLYTRKQNWKFGLFLGAVMIGIGMLAYTQGLIDKLSVEERKRIELWAQAAKEIENVDLNSSISLVVYKILQENRNIPVILTDENHRIITSANLDSTKVNDSIYLHETLEKMKSRHPPIELVYSENSKNYIYYEDSHLLKELFWYPFIQISITVLFIFISYFAFSSTRRAEQNQVWVGMAKETAHQLGTPISSLVALVELLKMQEDNFSMAVEVEKDVKRLQTITERFSKIGSTPEFAPANIIDVLINATDYLRARTSSRITYHQYFRSDNKILIMLNMPLFEWVIENLWRNAVDAMVGFGVIDISVSEQHPFIFIDFKDTGKGISKSKFNTVFKPGYTTKKRGWGLGLSLAKRIIESYHKGKIFIKNSEHNLGTTFRIVLKKIEK